MSYIDLQCNGLKPVCGIGHKFILYSFKLSNFVRDEKVYFFIIFGLLYAAVLSQGLENYPWIYKKLVSNSEDCHFPNFRG